jgi:hypothetical protein
MEVPSRFPATTSCEVSVGGRETGYDVPFYQGKGFLKLFGTYLGAKLSGCYAAAG